MVRSKDGSSGLAVTHNVNHLPYYILWKNTAAKCDGYVVGMEPSTNFPNQRSFETEQGRFVTIKPGATASFRLSLLPLINEQAVNKTSERIKSLCETSEGTVHRQPKSSWSDMS